MGATHCIENTCAVCVAACQGVCNYQWQCFLRLLQSSMLLMSCVRSKVTFRSHRVLYWDHRSLHVSESMVALRFAALPQLQH